MQTYDDYIELFGDWQTKLLETADRISVSGNVHIRSYWRKVLARQFKEFLEEVNKIELQIEDQKKMTPSVIFDRQQRMNDRDPSRRGATRPAIYEQAINRLREERDERLRVQDERIDDERIDDASATAGIDENESTDPDFDYDEDNEGHGDEETVDGEFDYDEQGSVDMMYDDLNAVRDEYQVFMRMAMATQDEREIDDEEFGMLQEINNMLHRAFETVRNAIARRLYNTDGVGVRAQEWLDRELGSIEQPRTSIYLQNTGRDLPVVQTNVAAEMISPTNYGIMVPVRLFHEEDGSFTDYHISGREV